MASGRSWIWLACVGCWTSSAREPAPPGQPPPVARAHRSRATAPTTDHVFVSLSSQASLDGADLRHGGPSTFTRGQLVATSTDEWSQGYGFYEQADNGRWAVEARFSIDSPCPEPMIGFSAADNHYRFDLLVGTHEAVIGTNRVEIGATNVTRTYRVEVTKEIVRLVIDGQEVLVTEAAARSPFGPSLSFGAVMFRSCPQSRSTWESIAYETTHGPDAMWPPPSDWPDTTIQATGLIAPLAKLLPSLQTALQNTGPREAPCVLIFAIDEAVRGLLARAYDAQGSQQAATQLRSMPPFARPMVGHLALFTLGKLLAPKMSSNCAPGSALCPPPTPPAIASSIFEAVRNASGSVYVLQAEKAMKLVAKAYQDAIDTNIPGADAALKQLEQRLLVLRDHPKHCGF